MTSNPVVVSVMFLYCSFAVLIVNNGIRIEAGMGRLWHRDALYACRGYCKHPGAASSVHLGSLDSRPFLTYTGVRRCQDKLGGASPDSPHNAYNLHTAHASALVRILGAGPIV